MKKMILLMVFLSCAVVYGQKFENLAPTPPMGWNTWNTFGTRINEKLIKETADAMVSSGMKDAGYVYLVLDDAWMAKTRDANGNLFGDPVRFPSGMKALGDYIHQKGLKFGIYNCGGTKTCAGYPGSHRFEQQDANSYASWGVDYLKYDWCNATGLNSQLSYKAMGDALYAAGRPVVFSLCEWGTTRPWLWAKDIGHLWRTTGDIVPAYDGEPNSMGWKRIIDFEAEYRLERYAGPDHWNDADMLEVGNGNMTLAESRGHFSMWCILASPLMAGNDIRKMTDEIRGVLTDKEVIAIDQDPLGKQGYRFAKEPDKEIWVKELDRGDWAVCVLNTTSAPAEVTINWKDLIFLNGVYTSRDLWEKKEIGTTEKNYTAKVDSHDVLVLRLSRK
jgi:alpha-galactosidase